MRITNHVYLLSGAGYGQVGNVYAILSEGKIFLIDTGESPAALDIVLENLKYYNLDQYPITDVLITHMHRDHTGNAWYFREKGAAIHISSSDAVGMENGGIPVNEYGITGYRPCPADHLLEDGQSISVNGVSVETILMPGHTDGSLLYRFTIDNKTMIATGDFIYPAPGEFDEGFKAVFGWMGSSEFNKQKYIDSLTRSLTIQADILLGGHGVPMMINGDHLFKDGFRSAMLLFR